MSDQKRKDKDLGTAIEILVIVWFIVGAIISLIAMASTGYVGWAGAGVSFVIGLIAAVIYYVS